MSNTAPARQPRLQRLLARLQESFGAPAPPPLPTALAHVLWENVAYLADDDQRAKAFAALEAATGLHAERVLALPLAQLRRFTQQGGIHADERAGRLHDAARILLQEHGGDEAALLALPVQKALRALQQFPAIGRPGAEKILLFLGRAPILALESNGLRSLLRLGYGEEQKGYDGSYRSAQAAAAAELPESCAALQRASLLLRELGRRVCKRTAPDCPACPLRGQCPTAKAQAGRPPAAR